MVTEAGEPGATVSMVARRHGIHSSLLFRWRRNARAGERAVTSSSAPPSFMPVALPAPVDLPRHTSGTIKIDLAGGHRLRVEGPVDLIVLRSVIDALVGR
ncbi:IS66-like element accessory protein TnpA [Lichenihabitans psoromatis]|uniref:IS66-like element accessory protein TnpA n=1 Tax=Lichenihabitans psoromatis TaxID=2528642 RepID=UPI0013F15446|nr:transposase [Lichenihabitans psoromatis]